VYLRVVSWHLDGASTVAEQLAGADDLLVLTGLAAESSVPVADLDAAARSRLAVARASSRRPDAVVVDEPCAAGGDVAAEAAFATLRLLCDETGVPAVVLTRDAAQAARYCDRVASPGEFGTPPPRPPARQPLPSESLVTYAVSETLVAADDGKEVA